MDWTVEAIPIDWLLIIFFDWLELWNTNGLNNKNAFINYDDWKHTILDYNSIP